MKFSELAGYLDPLETTTGRNELVRILSELYRACSVDEIEQITYLIQGRLAPFFAPVEIGLGERMLVTALAAAYGAPKDEVSELYRQVGDLGLTAQSLARRGTGRSRSVASVYKRLSEVASTSGAGSVQKKLDLFAELLGELDPSSPAGFKLEVVARRLGDAAKRPARRPQKRPDAVGRVFAPHRSGEVRESASNPRLPSTKGLRRNKPDELNSHGCGSRV